MSSIDCGRFIAQLRKDKRITQTELADLLQVTNKAISRWETGEGYPDVSLLPKLAEVLEVSIDELLKGERKDSLQRKNRRPYVKFVNAGFSSIVLIIAALILFLAITYSTYKVWLGVVGYLIPVVVAVLWFFNQRNELFETCDYTDSDKQLLTSWTRRVTTTLWIVSWMIVPQIAIVAKSGNWVNAAAVFSHYVLYATIAGVLAAVTAYLIPRIIERRFDIRQWKEPDRYVGLIALVFLLLGLWSMIRLRGGLGNGVLAGLVVNFVPAALYALVSVIRVIRKIDTKSIFLIRVFGTLLVGLSAVAYALIPYRFLNSNPWVEGLVDAIVIALLLYDFVPAALGLIRRTYKRNPDSIYYYGLHKTMMYVAYVIIVIASMNSADLYDSMKAFVISICAAVVVYYSFRKMVKRPMRQTKQSSTLSSEAVQDVASE